MATVYGNTQGIRATQIKELERLYEQRQPSDRLITPEFAQQIAAISATIRQPICVYVNRRGQIFRVSVGTPIQTQPSAAELPRQSEERLSGIRCISAQAEAPQTVSLIAMVRQRLDALVTIVTQDQRDRSTSQEAIKEAYLAHWVPDSETHWHVTHPLSLDELTNLDFIELLNDWETDLEASGIGEFQFQGSQSNRDRVLLVGLMTDDVKPQRFQDGLEELANLVESAKGEVVGTIQQKRSQPHPQTVVGQGKVEEIALQAYTSGANLVVFDRDISASQARNLEEQIGVRVVDRTEVILDIFAQRAQSQEGKLQVELAQMEYRLPRLRGRGQDMSRLGGGIGTRGPGETKLETERRTIQQRITQLQQEVNQLQAHRARQRQQRQQREIAIAAVIGYTNAGKSTLLNTLTNAEVYVADKLFATLDPTTRRLTILDQQTQERRELLLTDTVGFIHELPPSLMDAFRATLEEVTDANVLLHLVDLSHPAWENHIQSVEAILDDLPATPGPALIAFNKIDRVSSETIAAAQQAYPDAVFISATKRTGLDTLGQRLLQLIDDTAIALTR